MFLKAFGIGFCSTLGCIAGLMVVGYLAEKEGHFDEQRRTTNEKSGKVNEPDRETSSVDK